MSKRARWIIAAAGGAVLAAVLTWQLWPEDEPTFREELAAVSGVTSVSNSSSPRVELAPDADLAALQSSVAKVAALAEDHDAYLFVFIGDAYFRVEQGRDDQRATELAWAAVGVEGSESAQVVMVSDELIDIKLPPDASLADATQQILDRFAAERLELPDGSLTLSRPAEAPARSEVRISELALAEAQAAKDKADAVLASSGATLLSADFRERGTELKVEASSLSDIVGVRRSFLDELGRDGNFLRFVSGGTEISRALEASPAAAIRLVEQVRQTGATVSGIDAALEDVSIDAPTPASAQRVLTLMNTPAWTIEPQAVVRLSLDTKGSGASQVFGDTAAVLRTGPTFVQVVRAGYLADLELYPRGGQRDVLGISTTYVDGQRVSDVTGAQGARALIDILRSGDWSGAMRFRIAANTSVVTTFASTVDGRASDIVPAESRKPADDDLVDGLAQFVKRWNASAG